VSNILLVAEHDGGRLRQGTLSALTCAHEIAAQTGGEILCLVMGDRCQSAAEALRAYPLARVLVAEHPALAGLLADRAGVIVREAMARANTSWLLAASSTFSKDLLPRVAGSMDAAMLTDVMGVEAPEAGSDVPTFRRPVYAGNAIATVAIDGPTRVLSVRPTAFAAAAPGGRSAPVETIDASALSLPDQAEFVGRETTAASRPELTEARVVVTGGRPLKDPETYERLIGGLADRLGGAAGATRAAVDSGIAPNDLQVGQTGKVVAPELYIACGVSGAIQHLAGMKDAKVVVAINKDPDAPIFEVADYGLVADLHQAIPELMRLLSEE
jgi:electron transfer flavoprotein alpha subunit